MATIKTNLFLKIGNKFRKVPEFVAWQIIEPLNSGLLHMSHVTTPLPVSQPALISDLGDQNVPKERGLRLGVAGLSSHRFGAFFELRIFVMHVADHRLTIPDRDMRQ